MMMMISIDDVWYKTKQAKKKIDDHWKTLREKKKHWMLGKPIWLFGYSVVFGWLFSRFFKIDFKEFFRKMSSHEYYQNI